ncbi:unannotated protein [freshwater metagenome]|uniref:Unannotated protein n=1 Tax=freshwater metagenome TaxID=449393 RepID=A0A6J6SZ22_9ZZZZ|nr:hypothetical protein [Actinomycetota bacterium]
MVASVLAAVVAVLAVAVPAVPPPPAPLPALPSASDWDYQLGGVSDPPPHVGIVARDRTEAPTPVEEGRYDLCYVNGFQIQPDAKRFWRQRWALVLKDGRGRPVVDEAWGEWLLDLRSAAKRERLARIVGGWTAGCAEDGFEAVEYDNLDSFTRSDGLLRARHATAYAALLVEAAHEVGLAAAQKNRAGWDGAQVGFDLAVAEECGRYDECDAYTATYGDQVLVVEYRRVDFGETCEGFGEQLPVLLRDRDLVADGLREWC